MPWSVWTMRGRPSINFWASGIAAQQQPRPGHLFSTSPRLWEDTCGLRHYSVSCLSVIYTLCVELRLVRRPKAGGSPPSKLWEDLFGRKSPLNLEFLSLKLLKHLTHRCNKLCLSRDPNYTTTGNSQTCPHPLKGLGEPEGQDEWDSSSPKALVTFDKTRPR